MGDRFIVIKIIINEMQIASGGQFKSECVFVWSDNDVTNITLLIVSILCV